MRRETVIDLGVLETGTGPEAEFDQPWPGWARLRRWRRPLLVVLAGLLVSPLAAATGPAAAPVAPLWTVPGPIQGGFAVSGQQLYLATRAGGEWTITAYRLSDGAIRWATPLDSLDLTGARASVRTAGGVPLAVTVPSDGHQLLTAYDPDTGRRRWQHAGWLLAPVAGERALLGRELPDAEPAEAPEGEPQPYELFLVDLASGRIEWTRRAAAGEDLVADWWSGGDPMTQLLTMRRDGRLTRHDLATGEPVATVDTPPAANHATTGLFTGELSNELVARLGPLVATPYRRYAHAGEELVILPYRGADHREVIAYDARTLTPRWRLSGAGGVTPCPPVVCVASTAGPGRLAGIDPLTGAVRWSRRCDDAGIAGGGCYLLPTGLGPGLVLEERWVTDYPASGRPDGFRDGEFAGTQILDAATGQPVTEPSRWGAFGPAGGSQRLLQWLGEWQISVTGPVPERTWLARLAGDPAELRVLGPVTGGDCEAYGTYLLCWPYLGQGVRVWRVR